MATLQQNTVEGAYTRPNTKSSEVIEHVPEHVQNPLGSVYIGMFQNEEHMTESCHLERMSRTNCNSSSSELVFLVDTPCFSAG